MFFTPTRPAACGGVALMIGTISESPTGDFQLLFKAANVGTLRTPAAVNYQKFW